MCGIATWLDVPEVILGATKRWHGLPLPPVAKSPIEAPDFIISAGDLICGGIDDSCQPAVRMFLSR